MTEANWKSATEDEPFIPLIMARPDGKTWAHVPPAERQYATRRFYCAAALLMAENGKLGAITQQILRDLKFDRPLLRPSFELQAQLLFQTLNNVHARPRDEQGHECNCAEVIQDATKLEDGIMTHQDWYDYVERVREALTRDFVCEGLSETLQSQIPKVPNYGSVDYVARVNSIASIDDALVAYEYYDEDENDFRIVCLCSHESFEPDYPAFDVARALLEHGLTRDACDSLPEGSAARDQMEAVVNL